MHMLNWSKPKSMPMLKVYRVELLTLYGGCDSNMPVTIHKKTICSLFGSSFVSSLNIMKTQHWQILQDSLVLVFIFCDTVEKPMSLTDRPSENINWNEQALSPQVYVYLTFCIIVFLFDCCNNYSWFKLYFMAMTNHFTEVQSSACNWVELIYSNFHQVD